MKRLIVLLPVLLAVAAVLAMPTDASAPGKEMRAYKQFGVSPDLAKPVPDTVGELRDIGPVKTPAGTCSLYVKVTSFSCVRGGRVYVKVDGKVKGYFVRAGKAYICGLKTGRYHTLYAYDSSGHWGPSTYYIYSNWSKFTWYLYC